MIWNTWWYYIKVLPQKGVNFLIFEKLDQILKVKMKPLKIEKHFFSMVLAPPPTQMGPEEVGSKLIVA